MNATQLHAHQFSPGIALAADEDGKLRVRANHGVFTADVQQAIAARGAELLELLTDRPKPSLTSFTTLPRGAALPLSLFRGWLSVLHRLDPTDTPFNMVKPGRARGRPIPSSRRARSAPPASRKVERRISRRRTTSRFDGLSLRNHELSWFHST